MFSKLSMEDKLIISRFLGETWELSCNTCISLHRECKNLDYLCYYMLNSVLTEDDKQELYDNMLYYLTKYISTDSDTPDKNKYRKGINELYEILLNTNTSMESEKQDILNKCQQYFEKYNWQEWKSLITELDKVVGIYE